MTKESDGKGAKSRLMTAQGIFSDLFVSACYKTEPSLNKMAISKSGFLW